MKFRPLHDRVLIKVLDSEAKTAGGIIIPDTAKEKPQEGEVVAIGPGAKTEDGKLIPMDVKVGDIVLFGNGQEQKLRLTIKNIVSWKNLTSWVFQKVNKIDIKKGD